MTATVGLSAALAADINVRAGNPDAKPWKPGWMLEVNGETMPPETEWSVKSRFGQVVPAVVLHDDGTPNFDRPRYSEAPNVNVVVYGVAEDGTVKVAVIRQPRPHANDPEQPGIDGHEPVVFGQTPMGFLEKLIGASLDEFESGDMAAQREAGEEAGAVHVLAITQPAMPWHFPNPTFVDTWSDLYFVKVNLARIEALKFDRSEPIFSAEYIPVTELLARLSAGVDAEGALYRMCTANSVWMIFFATHPELFAGVVQKATTTA